MDDPREALRQAVVALIEAPDADLLHESLTAAVKLAMVHPIALTGEAATVDPLLQLSRRDPDAYVRVMALVDTRRVERGRTPFTAEPDTRFDKTEYMRTFMDLKRQRQRRAVDAENELRPDRDRLIGRARLDFMDARAAEWKRELDELLARARETLGKRLPQEHVDAIRAQFWASVDKRLDEAEQLAREKRARRT